MNKCAYHWTDSLNKMLFVKILRDKMHFRVASGRNCFLIEIIVYNSRYDDCIIHFIDIET